MVREQIHHIVHKSEKHSAQVVEHGGYFNKRHPLQLPYPDLSIYIPKENMQLMHYTELCFSGEMKMFVTW